MKNILLILITTIFIGFISCNKSDNDPDPEIEDYKIVYEVNSHGDVTMDTIMYLLPGGTEEIKTGLNSLTHQFMAPSNNYHAKLYVSGEIDSIGSCTYSLKILDKNDSIVEIEGSMSDTPDSKFRWTREFKHISN